MMQPIAVVHAPGDGRSAMQSLPVGKNGGGPATAGPSVRTFGRLFQQGIGAQDSPQRNALVEMTPGVPATAGLEVAKIPALKEPVSLIAFARDDSDEAENSNPGAQLAITDQTNGSDVAQSVREDLAARTPQIATPNDGVADATISRLEPLATTVSADPSIKSVEGQPAGALETRLDTRSVSSTPDTREAKASAELKKSAKVSEASDQSGIPSLPALAVEAGAPVVVMPSVARGASAPIKTDFVSVATSRGVPKQGQAGQSGSKVAAGAQPVPSKTAIHAAGAVPQPPVSREGDESVVASADGDADMKGKGPPAAMTREGRETDPKSVAVAVNTAAAPLIAAHTEAKLAAVGEMPPDARLTAPVPGGGIAGPVAIAANGATASPFERMDQGGQPVVLHSGAQHVDVGIHDPGLGWVEVRAQATAGHVDATLVAASGQSHAALAAQLPSMAQFLQQRDVRVGTLAVQQQMIQSGGGGPTGGFGGGSQGGGNPQSQGQSGSGHASEPSSYPAASFASPHGRSRAADVGMGDAGYASRQLSYISVRA